MFRNIGFIGTGSMGSALALAADQGAAKETTLFLSNRTKAKAEVLCQSLSHARVSTNEEIAKLCGLIILGVKPQMMAGVLEGLKPILAAREDRVLICSMATGLTIDTLTAMLGKEYPMIRILPNTPAAVGQGIAQYCVRGISPTEKDDFLALMAPSGLLDEMEEQLMAIANCVSGCGVAFAALFMEALTDGAVACGLPRDKALTCAAQTLVGTGALYLARRQNPGAMKDAVCSPGGTTIQGVRALEEQGFRSASMEAVIAAYEKTLSLGKKT
ncbi:MAG: pyrroline-5-carboxylate reductase [Lawsonibacter sp.]|nr:pyrroline-5-carboxylate reductase [Lawsonibacter sp.]